MQQATTPNEVAADAKPRGGLCPCGASRRTWWRIAEVAVQEREAVKAAAFDAPRFFRSLGRGL